MYTHTHTVHLNNLLWRKLTLFGVGNNHFSATCPSLLPPASFLQHPNTNNKMKDRKRDNLLATNQQGHEHSHRQAHSHQLVIQDIVSLKMRGPHSPLIANGCDSRTKVNSSCHVISAIRHIPWVTTGFFWKTSIDTQA